MIWVFTVWALIMATLLWWHINLRRWHRELEEELAIALRERLDLLDGLGDSE